MRPVGSPNVDELDAGDRRALLRAAGRARQIRVFTPRDYQRMFYRMQQLAAKDAYKPPGFTPATGNFPGVDIDAVHRKFSGKPRP